MEILDDLPIPKRDPNGPLRLPIMDKYKESGFFVFGKVESGTLVLGHTFAIVPSGDEVQVIGIFNSEDKRLPYAKPGENIKVQLKNVEDENLSRGDLICPLDSFPQIC